MYLFCYLSLGRGGVMVGNSKAWVKTYNNEVKQIVFDSEKANFLNKLSGYAVSVGDTVLLYGHFWIVCHLVMGRMYLAYKTAIGTYKFGNNVTYKDSEIFKLCKSFESSLPTIFTDRLENVTVSGATSKIFIPDIDMVDTTFSYFATSNPDYRKNRNYTTVGVTTLGTSSWWLSSTKSDTGGIGTYTAGYGDITYNSPGITQAISCAFRPFCLLDY